MKTKEKIYALFMTAFIIISMIVSGCNKDNDVSNDEPDDNHTDISGYQIVGQL